MAEYLTRHFAAEKKVRVASAGIRPQGVHPQTIRVMAEMDINLEDARSTQIDSELVKASDLVITLCGDARDNCPMIPPETEHRHWPLTDPAAADENKNMVFTKIRDEIAARVKSLLHELQVIET